MGVKDLIITPVYLGLFTLLAYFLRPYVTSKATRKYFLPALWVRFIGAIALGLIYQFYYDGGDTFNYFTHGSRWIWEAFLENPLKGIQLLADNGSYPRTPETFEYSSRIWYYGDVKSFTIVRIVALFDLFTLHTYSASALFFAVFSFSGQWAMYVVIHKLYPNRKYLHIPLLFIPSVIFWGSGILKDTITLGALGWLTWVVLNVLIIKKRRGLSIFIGLLAAMLIIQIKSYILLSFLPMVFLLIFLLNMSRIKNRAMKIVLMPFLLLIVSGLGMLATVYASTDEYNIDNIAQRAAVTSYDIRYGWGARTQGDGGYDIGVLDGSWQSMVKLAPQAIVVSLFRPFLWEVKNPLMLLSALESAIVLLVCLRLLISGKLNQIFKDPFLIFCIAFSLLFAFAVGVSTGNFGTLMRYKIPMIPFFFTSLIVAMSNKKAFKTWK
ncbi:hypothetical protein [Ekhidna sp.]|uniref:hypothetical protein n=1 Tax=Ekhidna sp. TaxID=2608089 RepID=UPI0032997421